MVQIIKFLFNTDPINNLDFNEFFLYSVKIFKDTAF